MNIKGLFLRYMVNIILGVMVFACASFVMAVQEQKKSPGIGGQLVKQQACQPTLAVPAKNVLTEVEAEDDEEPIIEFAEEEQEVTKPAAGNARQQILTAAQENPKDGASEAQDEDEKNQKEEQTTTEKTEAAQDDEEESAAEEETPANPAKKSDSSAEQAKKVIKAEPPTEQDKLNAAGAAMTKADKKRKAKKETDEEDTIEFHFENADLRNLVSYMSDAFKVTFISDDIINPLGPGGKAIGGNKITFNTQKPLSKKEAWSLFTTFLDIAGLAVIPGSQEDFYRIVATDAARKSGISSYIGVDPAILPENDTMLRFVYFIENSSTDTMKNIVDALRSSASSFIILQEMKAFILTDKSYNIKSLMKIVKELDKVSLPQAMSILKLRRADAQQVQKLYSDLVPGGDAVTSRLFGQRKPSAASYLPEGVRIIAESRTNTLILLGPKDAIQKIEDFVVKHIDVDLDVPYSPLYVHALKYADASNIADIMNNVTQFGQGTEVAKSGGVRGEDKYLKPLLFIPEKENNRLIIKGEYDDYLRAKEIIEKLDEAQPQVAIEILILSIDLNDNKTLGGQLRNKLGGPTTGALGRNVNVQTSGFNATGTPQGIVENTSASGTIDLLGDLIQLVTGAIAGSTIVSLGSDANGVWGIFGALQTLSNTQVVSNPFLIATNKTQATVTLGSTRRVVTGIVKGQTDTQTFNDTSANLTVVITPQINSDGMILLDLNISIDDFLNPTDVTSAAKTKKNVTTKTIVANKEVMALGGLIQNKLTESTTKTPILGDIPLLGWLFKNKAKNIVKDDLLILLSARIIEPESKNEISVYTKKQVKEYKNDINDMKDPADKRDPIARSFFLAKKDSTDEIVDDFIFQRHPEDDIEDGKKTSVLTEKKSKKKQPASKKDKRRESVALTKPKRTRAKVTDFFADLEEDEGVAA